MVCFIFVPFLCLVDEKTDRWALDLNMFWFFHGWPACWPAQRGIEIFSYGSRCVSVGMKFWLSLNFLVFVNPSFEVVLNFL
jgi:hypothetical protein